MHVYARPCTPMHAYACIFARASTLTHAHARPLHAEKPVPKPMRVPNLQRKLLYLSRPLEFPFLYPSHDAVGNDNAIPRILKRDVLL